MWNLRDIVQANSARKVSSIISVRVTNSDNTDILNDKKSGSIESGNWLEAFKPNTQQDQAELDKEVADINRNRGKE